MVNLDDKVPLAWPRARQKFLAEPDFYADESARPWAGTSNSTQAIASELLTEYNNALRMYCAGQAKFALSYLLRAEAIGKATVDSGQLDALGDASPNTFKLDAGISRTFYAWVQLALHGRIPETQFQRGLQDLREYLMQQTYDARSAYAHEDEERLFTVLCLMAIGQFSVAQEWFDAYIKHRGLAKLEKNFSELVSGVQSQLHEGAASLATPLKDYFDLNRLGKHKFAEIQSFWLCVPIAVLLERFDKQWDSGIQWNDVLEHLLY